MALQNISINFPNVLTLLNAACGIISICFSLQKNFIVALIFIAIASIFDLFDGIIARRLKVYSEFGKQLDSLADVISFGVAPIVLGIMINDSLYAIIAYTTFICCAIIRLARFNVQKDKKREQPILLTISSVLLTFLSLNTGDGMIRQ
jgi:CDP-diacylglycerol--serine O-phosphatidyltransferase